MQLPSYDGDNEQSDCTRGQHSLERHGMMIFSLGKNPAPVDVVNRCTVNTCKYHN